MSLLMIFGKFLILLVLAAVVFLALSLLAAACMAVWIVIRLCEASGNEGLATPDEDGDPA